MFRLVFLSLLLCFTTASKNPCNYYDGECSSVDRSSAWEPSYVGFTYLDAPQPIDFIIQINYGCLTLAQFQGSANSSWATRTFQEHAYCIRQGTCRVHALPPSSTETYLPVGNEAEECCETVKPTKGSRYCASCHPWVIGNLFVNSEVPLAVYLPHLSAAQSIVNDLIDESWDRRSPDDEGLMRCNGAASDSLHILVPLFSLLVLPGSMFI